MTNRDDVPTPDQPDEAAVGDADQELGELITVMREIDQLAARATLLLAEIDGRRAVAEEGLPVETALQLHAGWTRSDVRVLCTAADVLSRMPATASLFDQGTFSWGHIRQLTLAAARFDRPTTDRLDHHLATHTDQLTQMEPEQRHWALEDAIEDHTPQRRLERREDTHSRADVLVLTPRLDGTGTGWFDLNPEAFTTVTGRLTAEADTPQATPAPAASKDGSGADGSDGDDGGDHGDGRSGLPTEPRRSRGRQLADALVRICSRSTDDAPSAPARTSVIIDIHHITATHTGELLPTLATRPPRILTSAIDRITCDTDLDIVLRSGTDLLAAKRYQTAIPQPTRRALAARDGGCRFPACRAPVAWTDVHHIIERSRHRDHHLTNTVLLCRRHHTIIHRGGWQQHLHPDGRYRITRNRRTWTTLPRRHQHLPPPPPQPHRRTRAGPRARSASPDGPGATRTDPGAGGPDPATDLHAPAEGGGSDPPTRGTPPPRHDPIPF